MKTIVTACIDGSAISGAVCDTSAWAAVTLQAPLKFIHVLEKTSRPANEDLSGVIGLGSREHLLDELTALDEKRGKLALEHGKHMLEGAKQRVTQLGVTDVALVQRHDNLLEALTELEPDTRLFVMGRLGLGHDINSLAIGSHLETVIRAIHTPTLVAVGEFQKPDSFLIAYDGSATANAAIERIAKSPLLKNMEGFVVMVGAETEENLKQLEQAARLLTSAGHDVSNHLIEGNIVNALQSFRASHNIGLVVMGAYGHSRIREFFVGSNTSKMISTSPVPILLLR